MMDSELVTGLYSLVRVNSAHTSGMKKYAKMYLLLAFVSDGNMLNSGKASDHGENTPNLNLSGKADRRQCTVAM
jgi:hypothetical protein